ncbi:hypothetical protein ACWD4F_27860 [Streptomyces aureus]
MLIRQHNGARAGAGGLHRLTNPGDRDRAAAVLLRHPDLLEVAALHWAPLMELLTTDSAGIS